MDRQELLKQARRKHLLAQAREKFEGSQGSAPIEPSEQERSMGEAALDYGTRILDYTSGLGRTAAAGISEPFIDGDQVTGTDILEALKGNAPSSEQYMERMGVPQGGTVNLPFFGEVSARDTAGFVGDIALDPLTYVSLGTVPIAKNILGIGGKVAKGAGKKLYKSGFKKIDEAVMNKGKDRLFSDIMLEQGVAGTNKKVAKEAEKLADKLLKTRDDLYSKLDEAGAEFDFVEQLKGAQDYTQGLKQTPGFGELADKLDEKTLSFMEAGKVPVSTASRTKTLLYDSLPDSAWSGTGLKTPAKEYAKALSKDIKEGIENVANQSIPGSGDQIRNINTDLSTLLSSSKPLQKEVGKGNTKNLVTSVDGILGAVAPQAIIAKKAADLSKTTALRTLLGKGLIDASDLGLVDTLMRRTYVESQRD